MPVLAGGHQQCVIIVVTHIGGQAKLGDEFLDICIPPQTALGECNGHRGFKPRWKHKPSGTVDLQMRCRSLHELSQSPTTRLALVWFRNDFSGIFVMVRPQSEAVLAVFLLGDYVRHPVEFVANFQVEFSRVIRLGSRGLA
jgi:hypothetical protein